MFLINIIWTVSSTAERPAHNRLAVGSNPTRSTNFIKIKRRSELKMMTKLIGSDALREWLKKIPLVDLSDGKGLCKVIFEEDFKNAIKEMPTECIVDAVPVVRCKDCKHGYEDTSIFNYKIRRCEMFPTPCRDYKSVEDDFFCGYGERRV